MLQKSRVKILEKVSRHLRSSAKGQSDLETFVVPYPGEYSKSTGDLLAFLTKFWSSSFRDFSETFAVGLDISKPSIEFGIDI